MNTNRHQAALSQPSTKLLSLSKRCFYVMILATMAWRKSFTASLLCRPVCPGIEVYPQDCSHATNHCGTSSATRSLRQLLHDAMDWPNTMTRRYLPTKAWFCVFVCFCSRHFWEVSKLVYFPNIFMDPGCFTREDFILGWFEDNYRHLWTTHSEQPRLIFSMTFHTAIWYCINFHQSVDNGNRL